VNLRVAAHKDRRPPSVTGSDTSSENHHSASMRAAAAAARVAARYANAPSYSEILALDARAAVRAAEVASKAALEAQAAAESVLAGIEAASVAEPEWEMQSSAPGAEQWQTDRVARPDRADANAPALPIDRPQGASGAFEIRWDQDLPARQPEPDELRTSIGIETPEMPMESWSDSAWDAQDGSGSEIIETVEPVNAIHANLIEFPREIVATRKVRPRRAEGPYAASGGQLSIFEVDPLSISIEPTAAGAFDGASASALTAPEWSGIELDAQPRREFPERAIGESLKRQQPRADQASDQARYLKLAPLNRRLMAAVVNSSLIAGAFLATAFVTAANVKELPPLREIEIAAALGLVVIGALYFALFYAFALGTPGMRYAGIALCTFDGRNPTRAQRFSRLVALLVSVLPLGLGVMWAVFDENHLSWHDRLSQTYLRKY